MADQKVKIQVGSSYNGQGINKALSGVDSLSKQVGKAAGAVGRLGGAFEQMGGTAGKAIGAVTGALSAIATGGIVGAIVFAVTALVQWFQKLGDESASVEKLKKALDEVKESAQDTIDKFNNGVSKVDKYMQSIERLATAHKRLKDAQDAVKKMQMDEEVEKMEYGPDKVAAQGAVELKKAQMDAQARQEAANHKVASGAAKIKSIDQKIKLADDTIAQLKGGYDPSTKQYSGLAKFEHEVAMARQKLYAIGERGGSQDEKDAAKQQLNDLVKAMNDYINLKLNPQIIRRNDLITERKNAKEEKRAAEAERTLVEAKNAKDLEIAERRYKGALAEATDMKEQEIAAVQEQVAAQNAYAYNWQALQQRQEELKNATQELKDAQLDYAAACRRAKNAADAAATIADGGVWNPNGATPGRDRGSVGPASNNEDWNGSAFAKSRSQEANYWTSHPDEAKAKGVNAGLSKKEQREYNDLASKWAGGQDLSPSQRKRLHELAEKDPEQQKLKAEKDAEKAKDNVQTLEGTVGDIKTSISNIETALNNLGLK